MKNMIFMLFVLLLAPILPGIINKVKAFFAGKKGLPVMQLYFDIFRLLRKKSNYSKTTTWLTRIAPHSVFAATVFLCLLIPFAGKESVVSFNADFILAVYLLALVRFFLIMAAIDAGSSFEGMGASREAFYGALAEPAFFSGLLALIFATGKLGFSDVFNGVTPSLWLQYPAPLALVVCCWFIVLLVENSRIPFDDPNTHLELTMIHEVMILDYSGKDLAMLEYSAALKLTVFASLLVNLLLPWQFASSLMAAAVFTFGLLLLAVVIGVIESTFARLRLIQIPKVLLGSGALGIIALVIMLSGK
jgi:formate hydrogenlyase subunit 4